MPGTIIDATTAEHATGGIGVVTRGLLDGMQSLGLSDGVLVLRGPGLEVPTAIPKLTTPLVRSRYGRLAYQRLLIAADRRVTNFGASRIIAMDSYVPLVTPPGVHECDCFVHDVLPITHPHYFSRPRLIPKRIGLASARRASRVFTSSEHTAAQIRRHVGVEALAVPFGCGQLGDSEAETLLNVPAPARGDYVVYVGAIEERKDIRTLVRAFSGEVVSRSNTRLAIVGNHRTPEARELRDWAKDVAGARVRFLGRLPSVETREVIRRARALVYPSMAEGFGLPVLEGMALGTPVVASDIPEIRSWAQDACIYFPPGRAEALRIALRDATGDAAPTLIERGRALSEGYRWRKFAAMLLSL